MLLTDVNISHSVNQTNPMIFSSLRLCVCMGICNSCRSVLRHREVQTEGRTKTQRLHLLIGCPVLIQLVCLSPTVKSMTVLQSVANALLTEIRKRIGTHNFKLYFLRILDFMVTCLWLPASATQSWGKRNGQTILLPTFIVCPAG